MWDKSGEVLKSSSPSASLMVMMARAALWIVPVALPSRILVLVLVSLLVSLLVRVRVMFSSGSSRSSGSVATRTVSWVTPGGKVKVPVFWV